MRLCSVSLNRNSPALKSLSDPPSLPALALVPVFSHQHSSVLSGSSFTARQHVWKARPGPWVRLSGDDHGLHSLPSLSILSCLDSAWLPSPRPLCLPAFYLEHRIPQMT